MRSRGHPCGLSRVESCVSGDDRDRRVLRSRARNPAAARRGDSAPSADRGRSSAAAGPTTDRPTACRSFPANSPRRAPRPWFRWAAGRHRIRALRAESGSPTGLRGLPRCCLGPRPIRPDSAASCRLGAFVRSRRCHGAVPATEVEDRGGGNERNDRSGESGSGESETRLGEGVDDSGDGTQPERGPAGEDDGIGTVGMCARRDDVGLTGGGTASADIDADGRTGRGQHGGDPGQPGVGELTGMAEADTGDLEDSAPAVRAGACAIGPEPRAASEAISCPGAAPAPRPRSRHGCGGSRRRGSRLRRR
jgi:hypothetical protein